MNVIDRIYSAQKNIDDLLMDGSITLRKESVEETRESKWELDVIYQNPDCSIGFAYSRNTSSGSFPEHCHQHSKQFIVCITGSVLLNIEGSNVRILRPGDCATISKNFRHVSTPLENNTKLSFICVPWDEHMTTLIRK